MLSLVTSGELLSSTTGMLGATTATGGPVASSEGPGTDRTGDEEIWKQMINKENLIVRDYLIV